MSQYISRSTKSLSTDNQGYLHLVNILEDEPGMPKYNVARLNQIVVSSRLVISKDAESGIAIEANSRSTMYDPLQK